MMMSARLAVFALIRIKAGFKLYSIASESFSLSFKHLY